MINVLFQSPLETLQEQRATLVSDQDKFDKFLVSVRDHKANHERKLSEHKQELETREQELSALESERSELLSVLEKQELSAQDVERITRDRTQLEESLRSVAMRKEGLDKTVWEREMNAAKSLEELEKTVNAYHKQAEKVHFKHTHTHIYTHTKHIIPLCPSLTLLSPPLLSAEFAPS